MKLILSTFLLLTFHTVQSNNSPIRQTTTGPVQGFRKSALGKDIDVFLGIPYAEPPVGDRRFRRPEPIAPWDKIRDATRAPPACYQEIDDNFEMFHGVNMWNPNTGRSEDCLYLNIWQPSGGSPKKATLFWIFGGSYNSGSATLDFYDAAHLAAKGDVVVVSIQYRVGPFGFLYLKGMDSFQTAQGNMALIDQSVAIKWFSENAEVFGGDRNRITLFGESAGAASANYHLLSPLTKNLVQSAILQSASALSPWAYDLPDVAQSKALALADHVNCKVRSQTGTLDFLERRNLIDCLQRIPAAELSAKQFDVNDDESLFFSAFVPTLDGHFISKPPHEIITSNSRGSKPILAGLNTNEGVYFLAYSQKEFFPVKENPPPLDRSKYEKGVKDIFKAYKPFVADTVAFEYGSSITDSSSNYRSILDDILGDGAFKCPVIHLAHIYSDGGGNVYLYEFNHRTSANPWPRYMGVMHGYEIDHVFGLPLNESRRYGPEEKMLSEAIVTYWTNFAKTGNPNFGEGQVANVKVPWPAYRLPDRMVLALNTTSIYPKPSGRERACQFWRSVVPKLREAGSEVCRSSVLQCSYCSIFLGFIIFSFTLL